MVRLSLFLCFFPPSSFRISSCSAVYTNITSFGGGSGSGVGDPLFTSFQGERYQVHGIADTVYNIISDHLIQINAQFVFINSGQCPIINQRKATNCFSHPGSYFGTLGIQTIQGDQLLIQAGNHQQGFKQIQLNQRNILMKNSHVDSQWIHGMNDEIHSGLSVKLHNSHQLSVLTGLYNLTIENSDGFVNLLRIEVLDWELLIHQIQSHGLLGQTWKSSEELEMSQSSSISQKKNSRHYVGEVDDYVVVDGIFGTAFLYNKFGASPAPSSHG